MNAIPTLQTVKRGTVNPMGVLRIVVTFVAITAHHSSIKKRTGKNWSCKVRVPNSSCASLVSFIFLHPNLILRSHSSQFLIPAAWRISNNDYINHWGISSQMLKEVDKVMPSIVNDIDSKHLKKKNPCLLLWYSNSEAQRRYSDR